MVFYVFAQVASVGSVLKYSSLVLQSTTCSERLEMDTEASITVIVYCDCLRNNQVVSHTVCASSYVVLGPT